jgi:aspartyl/asparaginyl beta-hydroxylase (cupin superfamily)
MITLHELNTLYKWASSQKFPIRKAPTSEGYSNKEIQYCWFKGVGNGVTIRKKLMPEEVLQIYEKDDILFSMYVIFERGTVLGPHKDPNIYREPYKRIQIPLVIPDREQCFMIWKGEKIYWKEGKPQVFEVMDYIHEGCNHSSEPMIFLFIDVKKDCIIKND